MRDRVIVAAVLLVVALAAAWPALSRAAGWNRPAPPALARAVPPPEATGAPDDLRCVEPVALMRASHMNLLADWRELAVRQGVRRYQASDGRRFDISLSGTCLKCHQDKAKFCDRCHDYADVSPGCWDCHLEPPLHAGAAPAPTAAFRAAGDGR